LFYKFDLYLEDNRSFGSGQVLKIIFRKTRKALCHNLISSHMFIISLNYIAPLEKIDALMKDHMTFLKKGYVENLFIASGRKIPRTGGIILATGMSKEEFEALMQRDPFVAKGLAEFSVIEFQTSQCHPDFKKLLKG
jgi:uncharacterized protein YciI